LRGTPGIHIGIMPKTGSIMEYMLQNDIGHLAYVEAVFPDERITLSEVNNPDHGIYNERTLTKEEWQALNPVFIQVS
jgi:surface antigen